MPEATKKVATKKATTKTGSKTGVVKKTVRKTATKKVVAEVKPEPVEVVKPELFKPVPEKVLATKEVPKGKYIFATGRRKTSVANIMLYEGKGDNTVNRKPLKSYFNNDFLVSEATRPFKLTGNETVYFFAAQVRGGGVHSQAAAIRHGISKALSSLGEEVRRVLKKNGLLTRDPREKERKKPGLKRARRAPQWAKR